MRKYADQGIEFVEEKLANYYEGIGGIALKLALEAEKLSYQGELAASVCMGLMGFDEEREIYVKHGWEPPTPPRRSTITIKPSTSV